MSTAADPQGIDWTAMRRPDFDEGAPLALVDTRAVSRRVDAVAHTNGTEALFGEAPRPGRTRRSRGPAVAPGPQSDALF